MTSPQNSAESLPNTGTTDGGWRLYGLLTVLGLMGVAAFGVIYSMTRPTLDGVTKEGESAYRAGDYEKAARLAEKALGMDPGDARAHLLLGKAHERLGEYELALESFSFGGRSDGKHGLEALLRAGQVAMYRLGRPAAAERAFRKVLKRDHDHAVALSELVTLLGVSARQREAVPLILRLFQQGNVSVELATLLGNSGGRLQNPELSERFRKNSPDDPNVFLARAWDAWNSPKSVDRDLARKILKEGLAAHPKFPPIREALVEVLWSQGNIQNATRHLKFCFQPQPISDRMWIFRGQMFEQQSRFPEAARCYWEAYRMFPDQEATFHLTPIADRLGNDELAEKLRERLKDLRKLKQASDSLHTGRHTSTQPLQDVVRRSEKVGRLWEAWAWCRVSAEIAPHETWPREMAARLQDQLKSCPDRKVFSGCDPIPMDFGEFPLPDWKAPESRENPSGNDSRDVVSFRDDAGPAGINFQYFNSPHTEDQGQRMYEFPGGGCAVLDYDGDGFPDLYFTQGCRWPVDHSSTEHVDQLFRNLGGGRFEEITTQTGLVENRFSTGVASGDFDNDGFPDLYVANVGGNRLYQNNGDGTFADVTQESGTSDPSWTSSAVIADLNGDGWPDIYSVNYLEGENIYDRICQHADGKPRTCMPFHFEGAQDQLFINRGDGRFRNMTEEAGIVQEDGKGLGIVAADLVGNGRLDLFVANDTVANFLFVNETQSPSMPAFSEEALPLGVAVNGSGRADGCMGIAVGDADGNGRLDLFVTNFYQETNTLYLQTDLGWFQDGTREANLATNSLAQLGFGAQFLDADLDGWLDLIATNGHIEDSSRYGQPFRMRTQFFYNQGGGRFAEADSDTLGEFFKRRALGRGLAKCDWNRDGQEDAVISYLDRPAALLTNTSQAGNFLAVEFRGVNSSRDAIGVMIRVQVGDRVITRALTAGGGYQASNERRIILGLGSAERVDELEITWPSGTSQAFSGLRVNRALLFIESATKPLTLP